MSPELIEALLNFAPLLILLGVGVTAGSLAERRHFSSIRSREAQLARVPTTNYESIPPEWEVFDAGLVAGHVVVSLDYFKRFAASWRILFGGRLRSFEPLMERGRREALLRMKEQAERAGYDAVINVRLETSRMANADGNTTAGIELLAYGTGIRRTA